MKSLLMVLILALLLVASAQAIPTTNAATMVGNNNFTLSATGCAVTGCWFEYGLYADRLVIWSTKKNAVNGTTTTNEFGAPITTSTKYYAAACDSTGCGNVVSFTTLAFVPLPTSTLGNMVDNMTESKFNPLVVASNIVTPYTWLFPSTQTTLAITIVFGMMFFFIFAGMWLRQRGVIGPVILGLLVSSSLLFSNRGLNLGIPVEFQAIAQALLYASLAGVFLSLLKR